MKDSKVQTKVVGIIAEYNPFHKGHEYHLQEAKRLTGADYAVVIMSGDFVQRGEPAVMDKYLRTKAALLRGADIVFELPVHFATASAELFAAGAVKLLNKLNIVNYLCFGSECGDIELLKRFAEFFTNEPLAYSDIIKEYVRSGMSYPSARIKALNDYIKSDNIFTAEELSILNNPNNILGIEYIKALKRLNSTISPVTVKRKGCSYHSKELLKEAEYPSASSIRNMLRKNSLTSPHTVSIEPSVEELLRSGIPDYLFSVITSKYGKQLPIFPDDLTPQLLYRLLLESEDLSVFRDVSDELANSIRKYTSDASSFTEFLGLLKSKNYTSVRISRALLHIVLTDKESDTDKYHSLDYVPYIRLLGFRKQSVSILRSINSDAPGFIITKLADAPKLLDPEGYKMLVYDLNARRLYNQLIFNKFDYKLPAEPSLRVPISISTDQLPLT